MDDFFRGTTLFKMDDLGKNPTIFGNIHVSTHAILKNMFLDSIPQQLPYFE